jgi:TolA-binding protein
VLSNPKTDDNVKSDCSSNATGDETKARSGYTKLLTIAKGELAAEALYYDAYFKIKMGSLRLQIQQFKNWLKNYSGYRYLVPKV